MGIETGEFQEATKKEFKPGDDVKVMRSSGEIEEGWKVEWVHLPENHSEVAEASVTVTKETEGGRLQKTIPLHELEEVNQ